jgi:O-methyltransferase involved in polyketide biosynthesis
VLPKGHSRPVNQQRFYLPAHFGVYRKTVRPVRTMKLELTGVEETLLVSLRGRAKFSQENPSILNDMKAIELVEQLDYDFARLEKSRRTRKSYARSNSEAYRRQDPRVRR